MWYKNKGGILMTIWNEKGDFTIKCNKCSSDSVTFVYDEITGEIIAICKDCGHEGTV
jgi:hypothetical protein